MGIQVGKGYPYPLSLLLGLFLCEFGASFSSPSLNAISLPVSNRLRR